MMLLTMEPKAPPIAPTREATPWADAGDEGEEAAYAPGELG